jgi:hypothetical protein
MKENCEVVMVNGHSEHHHNGPTCKDKWGPLYGEYKNIHDYISGTGHIEEYWEMSIKERTTQSLPKYFFKVYFELIDSFMHNKTYFNPPHSRDFMNPGMMCVTHRLIVNLHHVMTLNSLKK